MTSPGASRASPLRIVFLGSDPIALPLLDYLQGEASVALAAVYTQPDRPAGRGRRLEPGAIKAWAAGRALPVFQPERLGPEDPERLRAVGCDLALVMAYGQILREPMIAAPRLSTLNLHTSILPKFRGASPIQAALAEGETETGITLMRMVLRLDAGPIGAVEKVRIDLLETAETLEKKLAQACVPLLRRTLPALASGDLAFEPQNDAEATYCRKLAKSDGVLDFGRSAAELARRINALHPWPGCSVEVAGTPLKLGLAKAAQDAPHHDPGTVLGAGDASLRVATGAGTLHILRLQRPGGRMLPAPEFLRGFPIPPGTRLPSAPMPDFVKRRA